MSDRLVGWVPMKVATWPLVVEALLDAALPWPDDLCRFDLRWLFDVRRGQLPGRRFLSKRWSVSDRTARRILADVDGWFDPAKGVPPASRMRPARVPRPSRVRPAPVPTKPNNGEIMSRDRPAPVPPVSRDRPATVHRRVDPQPQPQAQAQAQAQEELQSVPLWFRKWLKGTGARLRRAATGHTALDTYGALGRTLEGIKGKPVNVLESSSRPVLRLWRELLEAEVELGGNLEGLVDPIVLISDACKRCPDPMFAGDVRGLGWEDKGGRDRSRNIAAICRLAPKGESSGATWQERLEAARAWDRAGRPHEARKQPSKASGSSSYLHRLGRIAGDA